MGRFTCGAPWDEPEVRDALRNYRPSPPSQRVLADAGPERDYLIADGAEAYPFPRGLKRRIHTRAQAVCAMANEAPDASMRAITLEDYVQDLARHFVGIDRVVPYLRTCFGGTAPARGRT